MRYWLQIEYSSRESEICQNQCYSPPKLNVYLCVDLKIHFRANISFRLFSKNEKRNLWQPCCLNRLENAKNEQFGQKIRGNRH